jgi:hypothetical protein
MRVSRVIRMRVRRIYVALLDEGVDAWRPVEAVEAHDGRYRLPAVAPDGERWEFAPGSLVSCENRELSDGPVLVATGPV